MLAAACPAPAIDVSKRLRRQKRVRVALVSSVFEVVARLGKGWPKDRNAEEEGVLHGSTCVGKKRLQNGECTV